MSENLNLKTAAYNQIEDVLEKLKLVMNEMQLKIKAPKQPQQPQNRFQGFNNDDLKPQQTQPIQSMDAQKHFNDASARYNQIVRTRGTPGEARNKALQDARGFLGIVQKFVSPGLAASIDQTSHMSPFWKWEADDFNHGSPAHQNIASKIVYNRPTTKDQPGVVVLQGLNFGTSAVANKIRAAMGPWMTSEEVPIDANNPKSSKVWNTSVRATKESWQRFIDLTPLWLDEYEQITKAPAVADKRFPPESQFNGQVHPFEKPQTQLSLTSSLINFQDKPGVQEWELGKNKEPQGIRLQFGANDPNFEKIRDLLVRTDQLGFTNVKPYPSQFRFDIYDLNAKKLTLLSQALKGMGYPTTDLNAAASHATGMDFGVVRDKLSNKAKSVDISPQIIQNSSVKNMRTKIDISLEDFRQQALQRYPAAFDPTKSPPEMQKAQQEGMYFITQRGVSVMADEPGSGKTVQTVCGCDFATPPDKKILVLTPPNLVYENWGGPNRQSAPEQFCGHKPEQVARCSTAEELNNAINGPFRWIVVPYSSFKNSSDSDAIATLLGQASAKGLFGSCMMDEIQGLKSLDSNIAERIRRSVTEAIPFRVGMSGTPADNDPSDIYSQLTLLRHPLLFDNGTKRQSEKGFAEQFVGGKESANTALPADNRALEVFKWAEKITPEARLAMLNVFATTFLRRNKEDIRHDIPDKLPHPGDIENDAGSWKALEEQYKKEFSDNYKATGKPGKSWSQKLLEEMGRQKVPHTAAAAIQHLQSRPNSKVFVVTVHPEFADAIATKINSALGDGIAADVSGDPKKQKQSQNVANAFKTPITDMKSILPGKKHPLRCAVYTIGVGAVGLNFSIAEKCIFNDMDWNPSTNLQAEFRVHRIDSKHPVDIQYMVLAGTYDEEMYTRVQQKGQLNKATNEILRKVDKTRNNPEAANQLAIDYLLSVVDSVMLNLPIAPQRQAFYADMREKLKQKLYSQVQPRQLAAKSWYKEFKTSALQHRHLW